MSSSSSEARELASGKVRLDEPADHVLAHHDREPREARRARPRDPRHARRGGARRRGALPADHGRRAGVLGRLRHRQLRRGLVRRGRREARGAPVHGGDRGARRLPLPGRGRDQRARDRRRARAGRDVRHPRGRARREARHAAGEDRPDLLAHRAAPVHRGVRRRATRTSSSTSAGTSTPSAATRWGSSTSWWTSTTSRRPRSSLAAEIAANAPLSLEGNKRVIRALRTVPAQLPDDLERELVELRESCFARRTSARASGRSARSERRTGRAAKPERSGSGPLRGSISNQTWVLPSYGAPVVGEVLDEVKAPAADLVEIAVAGHRDESGALVDDLGADALRRGASTSSRTGPVAAVLDAVRDQLGDEQLHVRQERRVEGAVQLLELAAGEAPGPRGRAAARHRFQRTRRWPPEVWDVMGLPFRYPRRGRDKHARADAPDSGFSASFLQLQPPISGTREIAQNRMARGRPVRGLPCA